MRIEVTQSGRVEFLASGPSLLGFEGTFGRQEVPLPEDRERLAQLLAEEDGELLVSYWVGAPKEFQWPLSSDAFAWRPRGSKDWFALDRSSI